jgi:penicillin-binding protein A
MRWKDLKESEKESIFNDRRAADKKENTSKKDNGERKENKEKKEIKQEESKTKEAEASKKQTEKVGQSEKKPTNPSQESTEKKKKTQSKEKEKKSTSRQHEIKVAGAILVSLLGAMLLYFVYFEVKGKDEVLSSRYNTRQQNMAQLIRKGDIATSDGVVVATTQTREDGTEVRAYPYTNWYAHTVGYSVLGGYGLEDTQKLNLLTSHIDFWTKLKNEFLGVKTQGDTLVTTLDSGLQDFCYRQLDGQSGSITVVEPSTGKILAMVSSPNFDPNTVEEQWSWLTSEENTTQNLMNHATQGTYPPGSTFKIITLLEYIRENPDTWQDFHYTCTGTYTNGDYVVNCHDGVAHGELDIYGILGMSCNGAFDTLAQTLDSKKWQKLAEDFGYNQSDRSQVDFPYKTSSFDITSDDSVWQRMQLAIGQGTTTVTPLLNLMMYAAVANDGVMMTPYLVDSYLDADGNLVEQTKPKALRTVCTKDEAELLDEFLTYVITNGTAAAGGSQYARVSGKTGSAQYDSTKNYHAWFCGYGTNDVSEIAVCVMIEKGGAGGTVAAPIAGQIFDYYFSR